MGCGCCDVVMTLTTCLPTLLVNCPHTNILKDSVPVLCLTVFGSVPYIRLPVCCKESSSEALSEDL